MKGALKSLINVIAVGAILTVGMLTGSVNAQPPNLPGTRQTSSPKGEGCLDALRGTTAIDKRGRVRFALHGPRTEYTAESPPDVVVAVDPQSIDKEFFLCNHQFAPSGALRVAGVIVTLDIGAELVGKQLGVDRFQFSITNLRPNAHSERKERAIRQFRWLPSGTQFGLERFREAALAKEGRITSDTILMGWQYVGLTPGGRFLSMQCVDAALKPFTTCRMSAEVRDNVALGVPIGAGDVALWRSFMSIAERYFAENVEQ
jgi:hypothetical protein